MDKRLAIIVPYRDRRKQLDIFIPHMDSFLKDKGIDYQIIVAEQRDDRPFNRGKLFNIVFNTIKEDFDYFCFIMCYKLDTNPFFLITNYSHSSCATKWKIVRNIPHCVFCKRFK